MNLTLDLNTLLQGLALLILGLGVKGLFSMKNEIDKMNGSIGKLYVWRDYHEKQSEKEHEHLRENIVKLFERTEKNAE